jgi:hypothetical protein
MHRYPCSCEQKEEEEEEEEEEYEERILDVIAGTNEEAVHTAVVSTQELAMNTCTKLSLLPTIDQGPLQIRGSPFSCVCLLIHSLQSG